MKQLLALVDEGAIDSVEQDVSNVMTYDNNVNYAIEDMVNDPALQEAVMQVMNDPEIAKKIQDLMNDPEIMGAVTDAMNDPNMAQDYSNIISDPELSADVKNLSGGSVSLVAIDDTKCSGIMEHISVIDVILVFLFAALFVLGVFKGKSVFSRGKVHRTHAGQKANYAYCSSYDQSSLV